MDILKNFGGTSKMSWLKKNLGDVLVIVGLLMIPCITLFVDVVIGLYVLSAVLIILGILYIKGGE